eukprot:Partr_v1_DN26545_c2_g1_i1_m3819 putative Catalyzes the dehydration of the S-form of NAD(P)HX at the expense of ATP, which is converted to ADP. Together with NAD(P)HX epimerase, which catalyzes the epimerization of the S- and R-forms, the enzyme allows the repair of both epimers of NAD(P)HX, a damaged form of NAD(P)H that is a result of enzymatic or heat-dependent hydration (By similarity)
MMNHLDLFKHLIPPLNSTLHKGQAGRIGIIGGSLEYTGAPFFAASTALRLGSDLVYIFCEREAGVPLKCLSPDFIVHPCIQSDTDRLTAVEYKDALRTTLQTITDSIGKLHAVLIGPGAGRAPMMLDVIRGIIPEVRKADIPLVIDADGLFALMDGHHGLIAGYQKAIITPNIMELGRLVQHVVSLAECRVGKSLNVKGPQQQIASRKRCRSGSEQTTRQGHRSRQREPRPHYKRHKRGTNR